MDNVIYFEQFILDTTARQTKRQVYSFLEAISFIGGFWYMWMLFWSADLVPLAEAEFKQEAFNKLIAGQEEKLNMGWFARWPVARRMWCCVSKEKKDHWIACENVLNDQLNLVNMALRINKG